MKLTIKDQMIDKQLKLEISQIVNQAAREAYMMYNEEWISAKEVCKQFQMITKSWMKSYRHLLPQSTLRYKDKDGNVHESQPAFPKHRINQMIIDGQLDFTLPRAECIYRASQRK